MHAFEWKGQAWTELPDQEEVTVTIQHDGDPINSNIKVSVPVRVGAPQVSHFSEGGEDHHIAELWIPYDALKAFFAEMVRRRRISELEQMDDDEVLHLLA